MKESISAASLVNTHILTSNSPIIIRLTIIIIYCLISFILFFLPFYCTVFLPFSIVMSLINFKSILSCSSEDQVHCAANLLKPEQSKKWLSAKATEQRITCILELEKRSSISSVDIGNDGSAFIELLVSQSSSLKPDDWTVLLPSTVLMTPSESRSNTNRQQIKSFKSSPLDEKWDRVKIVCEQKYNRVNQFGLNFIKLYSMSDVVKNIQDENEQKKIKKSKLTSNDEIQTNDADNDKLEIMKNISFMLSGFQNPLRSELRNKATSMGAIYNEDWNEKCTHLICAFPNTPKFTQVQQTGKGFIVNKQWILDCYKKNQLLSEKSYELKGMDDNEKPETKKRKTKESEEESAGVKKKSPVKKKSITTNEDATKKLKVGEIPDFFHEKHFYVSYGDYEDNTLLDITRVILAYDGILERQITSDVTYVITNRMWNQDFEKISKSNPDINFINLDWLQDCHDANQFVPIQPYLIVP